MNNKKEIILIVDFGSQLTQLIARRVREWGVYSEIQAFNKISQDINKLEICGIIFSGGPHSVIGVDAPSAPKWLFELNVPILGICYGQQTIVNQLGGEVINTGKREYGKSNLTIIDESPLFKNIWEKGNDYQVWMSHGDSVNKLPNDFRIIAKTENAPYAAISSESKKYYGLQFHPEVYHTINGNVIIKNFLDICGVSYDWTMSSFFEVQKSQIQTKVKDGKVICGLSGGVDSSVVAVLLHKIIGQQLTCIYIDNGLMRKNESEQVVSLFKKHYNIPLVHVDASEIFLKKLSNISDPEQKRKIIGAVFIDVFEEEASKIGNVDFLAQGTLYPDVIESVSFTGGPSVTIKSHHNVGGLPEKMNLKLVEPLRQLFKDEVRLLGKELGLPESFISRHPFPGPGLAIRCPGEITMEKLEILRNADEIYIDEIKKAGLYNDIWQAFAVLLPTRTVGVMGDARTYEYVCALRAVTSVDGMTADIYHFKSEFLAYLSNKIINSVKGINRVVYDVTSKPPGTIEWE
jgi:GMP synthase (glutamine-hydrolysing)